MREKDGIAVATLLHAEMHPSEQARASVQRMLHKHLADTGDGNPVEINSHKITDVAPVAAYLLLGNEANPKNS
jgi:hypothetical protein